MRARDLAAVWAFVQLGWREARADRVGTAARTLLFSIIVLVFCAIWAATPLAQIGAQEDPSRIAWYVMVTEWSVFIGGLSYREVEDEIRSGAVEAALTRPLPYALAVAAEWLGAGAYRLIVLGVTGFAIMLAMTGTLPFSPAVLPALIPAVAVGAALLMLLQLATGLLTAWLSTPAPVFWVWQKSSFVFGGLLIPLQFYPPLMRAIGEATPFAASMFHPASLVFDASPAAWLRVLAWQAVWLVAIAASVVLVANAATRRFLRDGV